MKSDRIISTCFSRLFTVAIAVIVMILLQPTTSDAQEAETYTFTTSTGQSLDNMSGSSSLIGVFEDDDPSANTNIGFNFSFEGIVYTTFSVTPDGFMKLGAVASGQPSNNMTSTTNIPKLCPWWDDISTGGIINGGGVKTVQRGSSPNRIRVVQWFVCVPRNTGILANPNATFQVWIYETTNVIEFRYGSASNSGTSSTVGIRGATTTPASFISVTTSGHTASNSTANNSNTNWPGNGRMYRFTPPPPCSGTPNPGNTLATPNPVCSGSTVTLALQNAIAGSGVAYQWQSSPTGSSYTNISGANTFTYVATITANTFFRCRVTCTGSGNSSNSTAIQVTLNSFMNCYCIPTYNNGAGSGDYISAVRLNPGNVINNTTGASASPYYTLYNTPNPTINISSSYSLIVRAGTYTDNDIRAWIDFNRNGIFESSESIGFIYGLGANPATSTFNFTVPVGASVGQTMMRVRETDDTGTNMDPCATLDYGETEDYYVTIAAAIPCSGSPSVSAAVSTQAAVCPGENFTLGLTSPLPGSGYTFQWQSSPNNSTWTNITSATNISYTTTQTASTWYRLRVACTNSGQSANSASVQVVQTICYCTSSATNTADEEILNVTLGTLNNTSNCSTLAPGPGSTQNLYSNFEGYTAVPVILQSQIYSIHITGGQCGSNTYTDYVSVYIDFNRDGDYSDATDLAFVSPGVSCTPSGTVINGSITVPACASTGNTGMRVIINFNAPVSSPCGTYTYGETEDYVVNIGTGTVVNPVASNITGPLTGSCGSTLTYTVNAGYVGTIQWQTGTSSSGPWTDIAGANSVSQPLVPPTTGTYYLRVRFIGQGCVSDVISNVLTIVIGTPTVNITANTPNSVCRGTNVTLTASGPAPYLWNTGATTQSITVIPIINTTYTVSAGSGSCIGTGTKTISITGGPVASPTATPSNIRCPGTTRTLNANLITTTTLTPTFAGGAITINTTGTASPYPSTVSVSGLTGTPTVANIKINGLSHTSPNEIDIALVAPNGSRVLLLADNGGTNDISGINLVFQDGSPALPSTLTSGTFRTTSNTGWSGSGISSPFGTLLSSYSGSFNGTWSLYVYDDNNGDNGSITSWSITFNNPVTLNTNGPVTYNWVGSNGFTANTANTTDNPMLSTTYTLTVADNTCSSSSQVTVMAHPQPSVSTFTGSPFCQDAVVEFFTDGSGVTGASSPGTLSLTISGPSNLDETTWQIRNDQNVVIASGGPYLFGSTNTVTISPSASAYPITLTVETQGNFGDNIANYSLTCNAPGGGLLTSGTVNPDETFTTIPYMCGPVAGLTYIWTGPNGFSSVLEDPMLFSATPAMSGLYTVTIFDGNGCTSQTTSNVQINENPDAFVSTNNQVSCDGFNDGSFLIGVTGGTPFFQYFESNTSTNNFDGFFFGLTEGYYYVSVTDINGCQDQTPIEVFVGTVPNAPPVISCPADITVFNDQGSCGALVTYVTPVGSDVCPIQGTVQTAGEVSGAFFPVGTTTNTFEVTDALNLTASCSFNVTVIDNRAPLVGVAAADLIVECDGAGNTAELSAWLSSNGGALASDECGIDHWSNDFSAISNLCGQTGSASVTFTATDVHNNSTSTTASFIIVDTTPPAITAAANQTVECNGSGNSGALISWLLNHGGSSASDVCSGVSWSNNFTGLSNMCGATGSATVTFTASDACGNSSQTTATFTIVDTTDPTITAASNQTVQCNGSGNTTALNSWLSSHGGASASDGCSGISWSHNYSGLSNLCGATGQASVIFTATDGCGNASSTTATFTIVDNTAPAITAAASQTVQCDGAGNTAALSSWLASHGGATASDQCSGVSWSDNYSSLSSICGATGTASVTFTATDACGNASVSTASFTIVDNIAPVVTAAANQTVQCDGAGNTAALNAWLASNGGATASDICSGVSWSNDYSVQSGNCGATGTTSVTFTATDACGNASATTASFTIFDNIAPSLTAAANQTVQCDGAGNTAALNAWLASNGGATASDLCSGVSWSNDYVGLSSICGATGTASVIFTATDACGNASTTSASFTIIDNIPPAVTAAADETVQCDGAGNIAALNAWIASNGGAFASDQCSGVSWSNNYTGLSDLCGQTGTASVIFTATDACGNASNTSATFAIVDNTPPTLICPADIVLNTEPGLCGATVSYLATASDVCSGTTGVVYDIAPGTFFNKGVTTVNVASTDACGNTSNCSFTVTVNDNENPSISCSPNITGVNDPGVCGKMINYSLTIGDNCPGTTYAQIAGLSTGTVFPVGTTVNTFEATDASGNISSCSFSVTISDIENPTISNCPADFSSCNPITWTPPIISDNCPGVQIVSSHVPGTNFGPGTTLVTYNAVDAYNNASVCQFSVTRLEESVAATSITSNRDYNNICSGEQITLTINGGTLGEAATWKWYRGTCGGIAMPAFNGMTSITVSPTSTTTYFARAEGLCNTTVCASLTVIVSTSSPGNVSITSTPPFGAVGVTGVVTCTSSLGAVAYRWTSNLGHINSIWFNGSVGPVETTIPSVNVSFQLPQQNYQIRVVAINACGRSNNGSAHIRGTVPGTSCLVGPTQACPGTSATYSVSTCQIPGTNGYQWSIIATPANSAVISSGQGSHTISVSFLPGFTSASVCVNGVSNFGLAGPQTCLTVSTTSAAPGPISGNPTPCSNSTSAYSILPVPNAVSYVWSTTIPGASASGTGTTGTIVFPSGNFSGLVRVQAQTTCGLSPFTTFNVTNGVAGVPGPIFGPETGICGASNVNYSLGTSDANTYNWILPAGVTISGGGPSNLNSVNLDFPSSISGSLTISVEAFYNCGSATSSITVNGAPGMPVVTPDQICPGADLLYFVNAPGADSYNWTVTGDDYSECTDPNCSQFYVIWSAGGGTLSVTATNGCGTSPTFNVQNTCRVSGGSNNIETKVYPNPTRGDLMVEFYSEAGGNYQVSVTDMSGRVILANEVRANSGTNKYEMDLGFANAGMYMVYVRDAKGNISVNRVSVE